MLIALDARTIFRPAPRGTAKNLIDLYRNVATLRPDWRILAYHRQRGPIPLLFSDRVQPRLIEMLGDRFDAWLRWRLPLAARQDDADLLHCPANHCPSWMPVPTVVTIHDLIPLDLPQGRPPQQVRRFAQSIQNACQRAAWIICPSQHTRNRLVAEFDADPQRVIVNPWAPDSSIQPVTRAQAKDTPAHYGVRSPYVLHFGSATPRKNTRRLLEAWAMIKQSVRGKCQLLIVGLDDAAIAQFQSLAETLNIKDSVRLHGYAPQHDLPALLTAARALAYPSLSEGFGLPILDAWAAGTSVLTSDVTSLPEVAGDAALLVDPHDPCSISWGLSRLIRDPKLRAELQEKARLRLPEFSWAKTAARFVDVLEQAVNITQPQRLAA